MSTPIQNRNQRAGYLHHRGIASGGFIVLGRQADERAMLRLADAARFFVLDENQLALPHVPSSSSLDDLE